MDVTLSISQLQQMLQSAAKLGAAEVMRNNQSDLISKNEAFRRFGRKWIEYHLANGNLQSRRRSGEKNSTIYISTTDIITLQESEMNYKIMLK